MQRPIGPGAQEAVIPPDADNGRGIRLSDYAQPRLEVGKADGPLEREADATASAVVTALRRSEPPPSPPFEARVAPSRAVIGRRAALGRDGGAVDATTEAAILAARAGGSPMEPRIRRSMEFAFGADFRAVRLHSDPAASQLNRQINASAFTLGSHIFFRTPLPDTSSERGQSLLAHELTHTVQQGASPIVAPTPANPGSGSGIRASEATVRQPEADASRAPASVPSVLALERSRVGNRVTTATLQRYYTHVQGREKPVWVDGDPPPDLVRTYMYHGDGEHGPGWVYEPTTSAEPLRSSGLTYEDEGEGVNDNAPPSSVLALPSEPARFRDVVPVRGGSSSGPTFFLPLNVVIPLSAIPNGPSPQALPNLLRLSPRISHLPYPQERGEGLSLRSTGGGGLTDPLDQALQAWYQLDSNRRLVESRAESDTVNGTGTIALTSGDAIHGQICNYVFQNRRATPYVIDFMHESRPAMQALMTNGSFLQKSASFFWALLVDPVHIVKRFGPDVSHICITGIEVVVNKAVSDAFNEARRQLEASGRPLNEQWLFSGYSNWVTDTLVVGGHRPDIGPYKPGAYAKGHGALGRGAYFTDRFDKAVSYAEKTPVRPGVQAAKVVLNKAILGNPYITSSAHELRHETHESLRRPSPLNARIPPVTVGENEVNLSVGQYDSIRSTPSKPQGGSLLNVLTASGQFDSDEYVIRNPDQIFPQFVIHVEIHR